MAPFMGVLCWEAGGNPRGLEQLEGLVGNSVNPETYGFPVVFTRVPGANYDSVIHHPDEQLLASMIGKGRELVDQGVKVVITSCGFTAVFQKALSQALPVPVYTSALMQIPLILSATGSRNIAVITASKQALEPRHFAAVGVTDLSRIRICGMDEQPEWSKIHLAPTESLCLDRVEAEIVSIARAAQKADPDLGSILLECTDLPPFAPALVRAVGLPVYDLVSMVTLIHATFSSPHA